MAMTEEKRLFLKRLIEVVNMLGYPERGRQTQLALRYKVTQGATRKWFAAEAMPAYEISLDLCMRANVNYDWLMTGRGSKSADEYPVKDPRIAHVLKVMESMPEYKVDQAVKIIDTIAEPAPNGDTGHKAA